MNKSNDTRSAHFGGRTFSIYPAITLAISLLALSATFILSNSALGEIDKTRGFAAIVALFIAACFGLNWMQSKQAHQTGFNDSALAVESGLLALEEASAFLSGSLKPSDAFRLVSSRVRDLLPYKTIVLYLLNDTRTHLIAAEAEGVASNSYKGKIIGLNNELAGRTYSNRRIETDNGIDGGQQFASTVTIPLLRGADAFGVLQLWFDADREMNKVPHSLFEAIGTRVAPMILSSIAFERSQANALTDTTTQLPNERAFYMVLENQVAEAQRKQESRPLTVLAMDIKNFDEINQQFGHAAGDRVLKFVAQITKDNLRDMDFFARSQNDEFLAVLPTATREISHDIIARIHTGFFGRKLEITDGASIEIDLNIGWAAFGGDGETPEKLLGTAQLRKDQSKSAAPNKVLWFPHELVN